MRTLHSSDISPHNCSNKRNRQNNRQNYKLFSHQQFVCDTTRICYSAGGVRRTGVHLYSSRCFSHRLCARMAHPVAELPDSADGETSVCSYRKYFHNAFGMCAVDGHGCIAYSDVSVALYPVFLCMHASGGCLQHKPMEHAYEHVQPSQVDCLCN